MSRRPNGNPMLKVLAYVDEYIQKHEFSPSYRNICDGTGIKAPSQVKGLLGELCAKGYVGFDGKTPRSLRILPAGRVYLRQQAGMPGVRSRGIASYVNRVADIGTSRLARTMEIRVLGNTFAALPTLVPTSDFSMYDYESTLSVAADMLPSGAKAEDMFALEVRGDSMIEAHINEGDYILVQRAETANNGEMVVVWLDDENATTLKYFHRRENHIELKPANSKMKSIMISGDRPLRIIGKVVQVVRL